MKSSPLVGNIIVYVACIVLCAGVVWQIATGQADSTWHLFRGSPVVWRIILAIILPVLVGGLVGVANRLARANKGPGGRRPHLVCAICLFPAAHGRIASTK